jgi:nicotinate-nucleotide adenylyltransferase
LNHRPERIGIFGGAFDPPHNAHLALAQTALAELELDVLHVIPTGQAWHKARTLSAPEHRLAMTRLAFAGTPRVMVDDREIKRAGPTFTIDTLQALQVENGDAQLYLLMGADQFGAFKQWHQWQDILGIAIICVAARAQSNWATALFEAEFGTKNEVESEFTGRVLALPMPQMPVSATQIRQILAQSSVGGLGENEPLADLLPTAVASYIAQHELYKAT